MRARVVVQKSRVVIEECHAVARLAANSTLLKSGSNRADDTLSPGCNIVASTVRKLDGSRTRWYSEISDSGQAVDRLIQLYGHGFGLISVPRSQSEQGNVNHVSG